MSELRFENLCRLCLKESFLHANIFIDRVPLGSLIYEVLNFVYSLEITIDDGISANICRPCFWKLREFEIYKINVHQAKSEILTLIGKKRDNSIKEEIQEMVISGEQDENHQELQRGEYESCPDVPEEGMMATNEKDNASTTDNSIKIEFEEMLISGEHDENHQELEREVYESSPDVLEEGMVSAFEEDNASTAEIMQNRKGNHFVDSCNPSSSYCMSYVDCAEDEEKPSLESIQGLDECVEQQEKGKRAMRTTGEKSDYDCEHVEMMVKKEVEKDESNIVENEVASLLENNIKEENEEGLSELRISIVERANEKMSVISEREDRIKCYHCGDQRDSKKEMMMHIRVAHGFADEEDNDPKEAVTINNCKEVMRKGDLRKHSRASSDGKTHYCNICDTRFRHKASLRRHIRKHSEKKTYKCSLCSYKCSDNANIKRHEIIHSDEKPHKCSICKHRFARNEQLQTHMRIHSGEKPYKCSICDYKCSDNANLKRHIITHSGEKSYKCSICAGRFSRNGQLKIHMRIHSGEKPYTCSMCDYKCSTTESLKRHIIIHSGEKPYKCSICDYRCYRNRYLKQHIKTHNK